MENRSKKNISIFMMVGGLMVTANHLFKLNLETDKTNYFIVIGCSIIYTIIGLISFLKYTKLQRK